MKDRISLYPGRVKLEPVEGQENVFDMTRADQPKQEATPLSKSTLLTDETAEKLGLTGEDPMVDDALGGLNDDFTHRYKVGDVRISSRTDMGDNWLLCNGDKVEIHDYSELAELFPSLYKEWIMSSGEPFP